MELKYALINLLVYPLREEGNFNLMTDARHFAIGLFFSQEKVRETPVAYAFRTLYIIRNNYSVIQKELAIIWDVKYFRPYISEKF